MTFKKFVKKLMGKEEKTVETETIETVNGHDNQENAVVAPTSPVVIPSNVFSIKDQIHPLRTQLIYSKSRISILEDEIKTLKKERAKKRAKQLNKAKKTRLP